MRFSFRLFTENRSLDYSKLIVPILERFGITGDLKVSRTAGPKNWYQLERASIENPEAPFRFPLKELDRTNVKTISKVPTYFVPGKVLDVILSFSSSDRISQLCRELHQRMPPAAQGFFCSDAILSFGPCDITAVDEDAEEVTLKAVSMFQLFIMCDDFRGDISLFASTLPDIPEYRALVVDLEELVGPLHFDIL